MDCFVVDIHNMHHCLHFPPLFRAVIVYVLIWIINFFCWHAVDGWFWHFFFIWYLSLFWTSAELVPSSLYNDLIFSLWSFGFNGSPARALDCNEALVPVLSTARKWSSAPASPPQSAMNPLSQTNVRTKFYLEKGRCVWTVSICL